MAGNFYACIQLNIYDIIYNRFTGEVNLGLRKSHKKVANILPKIPRRPKKIGLYFPAYQCREAVGYTIGLHQKPTGSFFLMIFLTSRPPTVFWWLFYSTRGRHEKIDLFYTYNSNVSAVKRYCNNALYNDVFKYSLHNVK